MVTNGVMEEIRSLLAQGKSSGEIITLGFKPPTVYKVQRQLKRKGSGRVTPAQYASPSAATVNDEGRLELEAEILKLRQEGANLKDRLECWVETSANLEATAQTLRDRVTTLETETAAVARHFRLTLKLLEAQVESLARAQTFQGEQLALWEERWNELSPLLTAMCTQLHCADDMIEASNRPQYPQRRSEEAMAIVRKLSQYKGEEAEQTAALVAMLMSNDPPAAKNVNSWR